VSEFKRENRYLVLKRSDIDDLSDNWKIVLERVVDQIGAVRLERGKDERTPGINCVIVESDWPEYEIVWQMIQARFEGRDMRDAWKAMLAPAPAAEAQVSGEMIQRALDATVAEGENVYWSIVFGLWGDNDETRGIMVREVMRAALEAAMAAEG
jgi:hypothetical protein